LHIGQRQGDLLRLSWSAYDGANITLRQGKARRGRSPGPPVIVPCTAALRRMLDGMERASPLILTTKTGQSFKKRGTLHLRKKIRRRSPVDPRPALGHEISHARPRIPTWAHLLDQARRCRPSRAGIPQLRAAAKPPQNPSLAKFASQHPALEARVGFRRSFVPQLRVSKGYCILCIAAVAASITYSRSPTRSGP
jgi:hypothetical protein